MSEITCSLCRRDGHSKEKCPQRFRRMLLERDRGMTIEQLADQIFSGRSHLNLVLLGERKGTVTWGKLEKVLSDEELRVAKEVAAEGARNKPPRPSPFSKRKRAAMAT